MQQPQGFPHASVAQLDVIAGGGGFDCAIVAAPALQPAAVLRRLLPLLAPSAPFVVRFTRQHRYTCCVGIQAGWRSDCAHVRLGCTPCTSESPAVRVAVNNQPAGRGSGYRCVPGR